MSGVRVEIEVDDAAVQDVLAQAQAMLSADGLRGTLIDVGEYLLRSTRERAATETGPDGEVWAALSPRYSKRKAKLRPGRGLLHFDNLMLGAMLSLQISGETLFVGTSALYGARQQFGGGGIPARPWLGVSVEDAEGIMEIFRAHLRAAIDGGEIPTA